ncbi:hypothetical protein [Dyadobacter sediminis]|uniref:Uncharacterized protein n=1 Tax=Dyadobacter sediminis TaxID=1493691 RepID=A0A5R9KJJ5_9BACT|nr:hypothetical protein [Dyadobacter sediminis]TLU96390.1 hypothetical protein FEM55_04445 [Dyadobacter sediminis]
MRPHRKFGVYHSPASQTFIVEYASAEVSAANNDVRTFSADARVSQRFIFSSAVNAQITMFL